MTDSTRNSIKWCGGTFALVAMVIGTFWLLSLAGSKTPAPAPAQTVADVRAACDKDPDPPPFCRKTMVGEIFRNDAEETEWFVDSQPVAECEDLDRQVTLLSEYKTTSSIPNYDTLSYFCRLKKLKVQHPLEWKTFLSGLVNRPGKFVKSHEN